jgi:hypothetical protein
MSAVSTTAREDEPCYSLSISIYRVGSSYVVELAHKDPDSDAQIAPLRGPASFDINALAQLHLAHEDYGRALATQLFSDRELAQRFVEVERAAQAASKFLRVMISIDPSAQELQALRWELLRHPSSGAALSTSERVLLSRFMVSRDWRPVKLRARTELRAVIAVAAPNPDKLVRMQLAPVDYHGEVERVRAALAGVEVSTLGGPGSPLTLERLIDGLRRGVDILYLVCHGMFGRSTGAPALILQDETGEAKPVMAEEFATRVAELQQGPRLVVLASCESAGDGQLIQGGTAQASLAARLADAGVPGVIAMQGFITMKTVEAMLPVFFKQLLHDGQIDRALAAARSVVRGRDDAWMPALFTRLTHGRMWYTPGFRGDRAPEVWRRLLQPIANGKVVPIIGPRLLEAAHGDLHNTAKRLAGASRYPLAPHDFDDLPRVTEYMAVKESRYNVIRTYQDQLLHDLIEQHREWLPPNEIPPVVKKPKLGRLLALVGEHLRENENDGYSILAALPASVYVTTNYDPLLEWALRAKERDPQQLLTRWRHKKTAEASSSQTIAPPSVKAPLVYHVYGAFGAETDDGLVLTEDDYFDYLIETAAAKLMPAVVESALVDNSLLFLGFRLTDWHFRVLFRLMMNLPGRERLKQYCHVAVQLDPDMQSMTDVERAKDFLAEYFGKEANIDIYWGSSEEFLVALRDELAAAGDLRGVEQGAEANDDEWNF